MFRASQEEKLSAEEANIENVRLHSQYMKAPFSVLLFIEDYHGNIILLPSCLSPFILLFVRWYKSRCVSRISPSGIKVVMFLYGLFFWILEGFLVYLYFIPIISWNVTCWLKDSLSLQGISNTEFIFVVQLMLRNGMKAEKSMKNSLYLTSAWTNVGFVAETLPKQNVWGSKHLCRWCKHSVSHVKSWKNVLNFSYKHSLIRISWHISLQNGIVSRMCQLFHSSQQKRKAIKLPKAQLAYILIKRIFFFSSSRHEIFQVYVLKRTKTLLPFFFPLRPSCQKVCALAFSSLLRRTWKGWRVVWSNASAYTTAIHEKTLNFKWELRKIRKMSHLIKLLRHS